MNDFFWHQDSAFLEIVKSPLMILGIIFGVMIVVTSVLVIRSIGESDDN